MFSLKSALIIEANPHQVSNDEHVRLKKPMLLIRFFT